MTSQASQELRFSLVEFPTAFEWEIAKGAHLTLNIEELRERYKTPREVSGDRRSSPLFVFGTISKGMEALKRNATGAFSSRSAVVLDFDEEGDAQSVGSSLAPFAFWIYSTFHHQREKASPSGAVKPKRQRFRVVVFLSRPVSFTDYKRLFLHLHELTGAVSDMTALEESRAMHIPITFPGARHAQHWNVEADPLNPDEVLGTATTLESSTSRELDQVQSSIALTVEIPRNMGEPADLSFVRDLLKHIPASAYRDRASWMKVVAAIARVGLGNEESRAIACAWSRSDPESFEEKAFQSIWPREDSYYLRPDIPGLDTLISEAEAHGYKRLAEVGDGLQAPAKVAEKLQSLFEERIHIESPAMVVHWQGDTLKRTSVGEFEKAHTAKFRLVDQHGKPFGREKSLARHYLESPDRQTAKHVVFDPRGDVADGNVNLFTGFPSHVSTTAIACFERFISEVIASGDAALASHVWDYIAHLIQRPWEKPSYALILKSSAYGTGKNTLFEVIRTLIGRRYAHQAQGLRILQDGAFNSIIDDKLLLCFDEVDFRDRVSRGAFTSFMTAPTISVNEKFVSQYSVDSFHRVMILTNFDGIIDMSADYRRATVCKLSEAWKQDEAKFAPLRRMIGQGEGLGTLMQTLRSRDIRDFSPHTPYRGEAFREEIANTLDPVAKVLQECIRDGQVCLRNGSRSIWVLGEDGEGIIVKSEFDQVLRERFPRDKSQLDGSVGRRVTSLVGAESTKRNLPGQINAAPVWKMKSRAQVILTFESVTKAHGLEWD